MIVKRLDPQAVAGDEQTAGFRVPDGEGEHAAQIANSIVTVFFVQVDDGFGIGVGAVAVAARLQAWAQRGVIVDFAVEDDPNCAVFVAERLVPAGDVNNTETPHADRGWPIAVNAFIVWAAVGHGGAHLPHHGRIGAYVPTKLHQTSDATHTSVCLPLRELLL